MKLSYEHVGLLYEFKCIYEWNESNISINVAIHKKIPSSLIESQ